MKKLIKKYFVNLAYFYQVLGFRVFITFTISLLIGVLDGFGLTMFFPLFGLVAGNKSVPEIDADSKLAFIVDGFNSIGLDLTLSTILIFLVLFFLGKGIARFYGGYYNILMQQFFIKKLRLRMLNAFNKINFKEFIGLDIGKIQNAMTGEVEKLSRAFSMYFATFEQVVLVLVYIGFAFYLDFNFALLVTVGGILTNFIYKAIYKLTKISSLKLSYQSNTYQSQIIQHVQNFKYLKATALLGVYSEKLKKTIEALESSRRKIGKYGSFLVSAREPMMIVIVGIVIMIEVKLMGGSLGSILLSLLFFYRALSALTYLQNCWNKYLEHSGALANVKEFHQEVKESKEANGSVIFNGFQDKIQISDLSYYFKDTRVLNKINLTIHKNEVVGFAGQSGSGKTTLLNILAGLLKVEEGLLMIDGRDSMELDMTTFQKRIGYVTQEPVIFNDTIFNNITFWAEPTKDNIERFKRVLEQTSLCNLIQELPEKENTLLGHNGINISGGQKQRISIARELFKDIDILFLDEATSALDSETESIIQESIDNLKGNLTILIIAHRLSTVKNADKIVLMDKGTILDIAGFDDLRDSNEAFRSMVKLQEFSN